MTPEEMTTLIGAFFPYVDTAAIMGAVAFGYVKTARTIDKATACLARLEEHGFPVKVLKVCDEMD